MPVAAEGTISPMYVLGPIAVSAALPVALVMVTLVADSVFA